MEQCSLAIAPEVQAPTLRPYQQQAIDRVSELIARGVKAPLIVAPTGAGKTVLAAAIVAGNPDARILFLAPRRELIHQTCRKLDDVSVPYGVLLAGDKRTNLYARVQVASVDTLVSRVLRLQKVQLAPFDIVIVDEAHVGLTERRQALLNLWPDAKVIGLTATPTRSDGRALGVLYDELVEVSSVKDLTDAGFLVPARYFSVSEPDLRRVRVTAGDYNQGDLDRTMNQAPLIGNIVEHWLEHAAQRRTVVFATSIAHSLALAQEFIEQGVSAEHVDASTPQDAREAIFSRFASGRTQVLTNCTLASIGFDLPVLDCVVFARPTKSLGLYLQMLGRGLRPAPGKADCLVLDHAGNVHRHGFATDDRFWTLHGKYAQDVQRTEQAKREKEKKGVVQLTCPQCKCVWEGGNQCPQCGYYFEPKPKKLVPQAGKLVAVGEGVREWTDERKMRFFLELAAYGEGRGYKPGWASFKYKERFGDWPAWKWKQHSERHGGIDPSLDTVRWIKSRMIAWRSEVRKLAAQNARD